MSYELLYTQDRIDFQLMTLFLLINFSERNYHSQFSIKISNYPLKSRACIYGKEEAVIYIPIRISFLLTFQTKQRLNGTKTKTKTKIESTHIF